RLIQEMKPDVIFTDIRMPVIDGLELIRLLRNSGNQAHIVLLSGYKEFDYAKKAIKLGVEDYLIKPIDKDQLLTLMDDIQTKCEQTWRRKQYNYLENPFEAEDPVN